MSYDYALLVPEATGATKDETLEIAGRLNDEDGSIGEVDPRVAAFHAELTGLVQALPEDDAWISVWPLTPTPQALFVPVPYPSADDALLTLLRLAARHGLVLVDLTSDAVDAPAPGIPVSVRGGDGTRLGALTRERLHELVSGLGGEDPYLVLDVGHAFAQTYREANDAYLLEHSGDSGHVGTTLDSADAVEQQLWLWLTEDPGFGSGLTFERVG